MSDERPPTHRIHWRASADARVVGAHFGFCRTHEAKVRQATFYVNGGLIPERCHFGPRRVRLEGEVDYTPPRWSASQPSRYGRDLADDIMRWTLRMLYGMHQGEALHTMDEPANLRIEIRVRPLVDAS